MPKYDLRFDLIESPGDIHALGEFLLSNAGDYDSGRHREWVNEICVPAVKADERRALGWWQQGEMVGDAVIKPLAEGLVELKNFRILPPVAHRGLGNLMLKHTLLEAADLLADKRLVVNTGQFTVQLDTVAGGQAEEFFVAQGFHVVGELPEYPAVRPGVIMQRQVSVH